MKDERRSRLGALSLVLSLSIAGCDGCEKKHAPVATEAAAPPTIASAVSKRPTTTSAAIAVNNFLGDIDARMQRKSPRPADQLTLVQMLLDRAHYFGKVSDYELADKLASEMNVDAGVPGGRGEAPLARALVDAALHRFDAALANLDRAASAGTPILRINSARASIRMARGDYDGALALQLPYIEQRDSISIATAAVLAAKMNKPATESDRLFEEARTRYGDVSPFGLAWMDFQRGSLEELRGEDGRARTWFAEAVDVLPIYAHALVHLAPSLPPDEAIAKLEQLRKTADDPELLSALAAAHTRAGHKAEPPPLIDEAKKRYDALVEKYPEAFADHAARFYLGPGNDPKKALDLAKRNATNRPTEEAIDLWMATAAGAKDSAEVCAAAREMAKLPYLSKRGGATASAALSKCPDAG